MSGSETSSINSNPIYALLKQINLDQSSPHRSLSGYDESKEYRSLADRRALFWRRAASLHANQSIPIFHPRYNTLRNQMNRDLKLLGLRGYAFEVAGIYELALDGPAFFRALSDLLEKSTACRH